MSPLRTHRRPPLPSLAALCRGPVALRLLLALLALGTTEVVHALEHVHVPGQAAPLAPDGVTVHAEDCEHRGNVHAPHDATHCLTCQAGRTVAALPEGCVRALPAAPPAAAPSRAADTTRVPAVLLPLGARAPPVSHS